ncbi:glycosyltransferase [Microbacterium sp.]|uniref:glycosyltransferase n=1 Tax=Microbacterium sp. TaxID=51671 RepID=UPI0028B1C761|nr:glycosyltransferase [Microbacterium sp.]
MNPPATEHLVSVIVPVFNAAAHLERTAASILLQTHAALEVILVNDGSTDGSEGICDEIARTDSRVRVIHQLNGGIAVAQNAGLDAATGSFVTFCDNDDLMSPRLIERLLSILIDSDADMSCCRWWNVGASVADEALRLHSDAPPRDVQVFEDSAKSYQTIFSAALRRLRGKELRYFSEANWGKLYRASLFEEIRFPEGRYAQDVAIAMDLYLRCRRVASCNDRLYFWLQRGDSVSHSERSAGYYHDIVHAHAHSFKAAIANGILPARAYYGLTALRHQRRAARTSDEVETYLADKVMVRGLLSRLGLVDRARCAFLSALRKCEVLVYDRTVHRRR